MAAHLKEVDNLKQILKDAKDTSGEGTDLYNHLLEVFSLLIKHYPDDALDKIEEVSYLIKNKENKKLTDWLLVEELRNCQRQSKNLEEFIGKARKLFEGPQPEEEGGEPPEPETVNNVPDLLSQS